MQSQGLHYVMRLLCQRRQEKTGGNVRAIILQGNTLGYGAKRRALAVCINTVVTHVTEFYR